MSTYIYKLTQQITDIIYIQSAGAAVTGLVNANFTKYLIRNGAVGAETVTVTEVNAGTQPGVYAVSFTPTTGVGDYQYLVYATSYTDSKFTENFEVRSSFLDDTDGQTIKTKTDQFNFTGSDVKATLDGELVTLAAVTHTGAVIPTVTTVTTVTGSVGSVTGAVGSVTGSVGSVTGNVGGNVVGSVGSVVGAVGSVTGAVGSVTGNVGGNLVGNVNGNVVGSVGSVTGAVGSVTGSVGGNVTGSVGSVLGSVASVTAAVTVGTNNDKTGYRLSATGVDDVWDEAQSGHVSVGTFGKYLDIEVSSRLSTASYSTAPTVGAIADAVWDEPTAGHTTSGTFGEQLKTDVDAILVDTLSLNGTKITTARANNLDNLDATISSRLSTVGYTTPPTAAAVADQVWDEVVSGHVTAGTTGGYLETTKYHIANKLTVASGVYTVKKDDGTTTHITGTTSADDGNRIPA